MKRSCWLLFIAFVASDLATVSGAGCTRGDEPPAAVLQAEQARIAAIDRAQRTAVSVFEPGGNGGGSGVVITADGYALSNFHVVAPTGPFMQCGMADGRLYDAVVVGLDPTGDVALIKLLGREDFPTAELGDSDLVRTGDWCFTVGNPFLLATDLQPSVAFGIVSGVHRYQPPAGTMLEYADCLQTDAAINPGNSGGPLFDAQGRLIGINGRGSFEKRGRVNVGVGYAISINQIKKFLGCLHSGRIVDHATLGATVAKDEDGRIIVSNILESSDAYRRGLRYGDQLLSFADRPVTTVNGFKNVLGTYPRGWRVPLTYRREGKTQQTYVRLAGVHPREEFWKKFAKPQRMDPEIPLPPKKERGKESPQPGDDPGQDQGQDQGQDPVPIPNPQEPQPQIPLPMPSPHAPAPIPDHIKALIEERPGFANYYFNRLQRDRVWAGFTALGSYQDAKGIWKLGGTVNGGAPWEITLGDEEVAGQFPATRDRIDPRADLDGQLLPAGTGGLLPALAIWRRLLVLGPSQFGEISYLGTFPLIERSGQFDVLTGAYNVAEAQFSFDPQSGELVAIEMFPENNSDPCEIYFSDYRAVGNRKLPHRLTVRFGDTVFGDFAVDRYELGP
jgi:S1-C subfamily serine protease